MKKYDYKLSIIIISYNTRDMTAECISSVFDETVDTNFEVIVWDNASSDGSAEYIDEKYGKKITLIKSGDNIGFAAANNEAAKLAHGEYLLLLNPDTVVLDNAIDKLMNFATQKPDAGIWGGKTVFGDGSLNPASCWSKQSMWSLFVQAIGLSSVFRGSTLFNPEAIGGWDRNGIKRVDIVSGCFFLIKHELWDALRGFREDFFMYGEEADLCLRAHMLGVKPVVTSEAVIVHYGGASEKIEADRLVRLLKAKDLLIEYHFNNLMKPFAHYLFYMWPFSRCLAHKLLSVFNVYDTQKKHSVWSEVLERKHEWFLVSN